MRLHHNDKPHNYIINQFNILSNFNKVVFSVLIKTEKWSQRVLREHNKY